MYDTSPKYISRPLDLDFVLLAQDKSLGLSQKMGALGGLGILDLVQLVTWYLADAVRRKLPTIFDTIIGGHVSAKTLSSIAKRARFVRQRNQVPKRCLGFCIAYQSLLVRGNR